MSRVAWGVLLIVVAVASPIFGEEPEVDPLAQAEFARDMNETLDQTVLRYEDLLDFPEDRRRTAVILDTDIERINDATLFRQTALFPNRLFNFVDLTAYANGPARPIRLMFGMHNQSYFDLRNGFTWVWMALYPAPFSFLASSLELLGVYSRDDIYTSILQANNTVWYVPYTENFTGNYPERIRGLGSRIIGRTLPDILDDARYEDGPPPEERSFGVTNVRSVEFVDTRFFRASSAYSQLTLMNAYLDALYESPAERPDGGYGEYRWFGDDDFAVFNAISFELNLAALARAGSAAAQERLGEGEGPVDIYALAERAVEQLEEEPETKDITRYGTRMEQVPFVGNLSLFGYLSERNDLEPKPQALEAGADWKLGPLLIGGNWIGPEEVITGEASVEEGEYGGYAGLDFEVSDVRFRAVGERRLEFTEPLFYRAQAGIEVPHRRGGSMYGGATVTAPELKPELRQQEVSLGVRFDTLRLDAAVVQEVVSSQVENTFVTVDFTAAF